MGYRVLAPDGVIVQSVGFSRKCGARFGDGHLPAALVERMLAEGVIERIAGEPQDEDEDVDATASAKEMAARFDVNLADVRATGTDGRVVKRDVAAYLKEADENEE